MALASCESAGCVLAWTMTHDYKRNGTTTLFAAFGLKLDSILAVASMYSKLVPVVSAACLIAPAIRARDGSTPAVAVAFEVSTDICWCPAPRETTARPYQRDKRRSGRI
jgi:hypothetical protein